MHEIICLWSVLKSTSIVFFVHFRPWFFKKLILRDWGKVYTLNWCLITWQNLRKSFHLDEKISIQQTLFIFSRTCGSNKFFFLKKCLETNLWRKKEHFAKYFVAARFFRITRFSYVWFSWYFRIINIYKCFFTLNILFDEVDRGLGYERKYILLYLYGYSLKNVTDDLNGWLVVMLVKNKYYTETDEYVFLILM